MDRPESYGEKLGCNRHPRTVRHEQNGGLSWLWRAIDDMREEVKYEISEYRARKKRRENDSAL